jgi:hypothetical protein
MPKQDYRTRVDEVFTQNDSNRSAIKDFKRFVLQSFIVRNALHDGPISEQERYMIQYLSNSSSHIIVPQQFLDNLRNTPGVTPQQVENINKFHKVGQDVLPAIVYKLNKLAERQSAYIKNYYETHTTPLLSPEIVQEVDALQQQFSDADTSFIGSEGLIESLHNNQSSPSASSPDDPIDRILKKAGKGTDNLPGLELLDQSQQQQEKIDVGVGTDEVVIEPLQQATYGFDSPIHTMDEGPHPTPVPYSLDVPSPIPLAPQSHTGGAVITEQSPDVLGNALTPPGSEPLDQSMSTDFFSPSDAPSTVVGDNTNSDTNAPTEPGPDGTTTGTTSDSQGPNTQSGVLTKVPDVFQVVYHKVPFQLVFGAVENPNVDQKLFEDSKSLMDLDIQIMHKMEMDIINTTGQKFFVTELAYTGTVKQNVHQELMELIQLHFVIMRNMAIGPRGQTAMVPLKKLMQLYNVANGSNTTDTSGPTDNANAQAQTAETVPANELAGTAQQVPVDKTEDQLLQDYRNRRYVEDELGLLKPADNFDYVTRSFKESGKTTVIEAAPFEPPVTGVSGLYSEPYLRVRFNRDEDDE